MKKTLLALIMMLSIAGAMAQDKAKIIESIDQKVLAIDGVSNYQMLSLVNEAFLDTAFLKQLGKGYGQLVGYFRADTLCKISVTMGIEAMHDLGVIDYYFYQNNLIFVYEWEKHDADIFGDAQGNISYIVDEPGFAVKYYFNNDTLIETIEKGYRETILLPNEDYFDSMSKEGQLLYSAGQYRTLLFAKKH